MRRERDRRDWKYRGESMGGKKKYECMSRRGEMSRKERLVGRNGRWMRLRSRKGEKEEGDERREKPGVKMKGREEEEEEKKTRS